ncbi:hypothetical protein B0G69_4167 [Paraburkholderia sp. RAU2J]|nr:hypothetical protein B0G69_4167 [Paraburkholderia sp. RAU2J]
MRAQRKSLKPIMGLTIRLIARWSCSTTLFRNLDLAHLHGRFPFGVDGLQCGQIGTAFVYGDGLRFAVLIEGFLEIATRGSLVTMGSQQEIDGLSGLIHRTIQVLPLAAHLDVRFVHPPAPADRPLMLAKRFFEQRHEFDHPAVYRRMVHLETAFRHHLFQIAQAQRVRHVPPHAQQNHLQWVVQSLQHLGDPRRQRLTRCLCLPGHLQHLQFSFAEFYPSALARQNRATDRHARGSERRGWVRRHAARCRHPLAPLHEMDQRRSS